MEKLVKKYEDAFIDMLHDMCNTYKAIGCGTIESPMWLQYCGVHDTGDEKGRPKFRSSQCNLGFFLNYIDEDDKQYFQYGKFGELYDLFRDLKYEFIREEHPTIYKEFNQTYYNL